MRTLARWIGLSDMPKKKRARALTNTIFDDGLELRPGAGFAVQAQDLAHSVMFSTTNADPAPQPPLTIETIQEAVREGERLAPPPEVYLSQDEREMAGINGIGLVEWARAKRDLIAEGLLGAPPLMPPSRAARLRRMREAQMGLAFGGGIAEMPPVALGNMRDLLMPGLRGIVGQYRDVPQLWAGDFPRIDPEAAARSRERARGLLKSLLTPEQWTEFEQAGAVTERIEGCEFTLRPGGMIEAKKPRLLGNVRERWCVYPDPYADKNDFMPDEDKLIGQLLHLRAGPEQLRAKANVFPAH